MKKAMLVAATMMAASTAFAEEAAERKVSVGLASFATTISVDGAAVSDDFAGPAIYATFALRDNVAVRGLMAWQEHDLNDDLELNAFEGSVLFGKGLINKGFKAYASLGLYSETMKGTFAEEDFSGMFVGGGLGYNWDRAAIDFWVNLLSTGDYEDYTGSSPSAATGGLGLSYRM